MDKKYLKECLKSLGECIVEIGNLSKKDLLVFDVILNRVSDALTYLQMVEKEIDD